MFCFRFRSPTTFWQSPGSYQGTSRAWSGSPCRWYSVSGILFSAPFPCDRLAIRSRILFYESHSINRFVFVSNAAVIRIQSVFFVVYKDVGNYPLILCIIVWIIDRWFYIVYRIAILKTNKCPVSAKAFASVLVSVSASASCFFSGFGINFLSSASFPQALNTAAKSIHVIIHVIHFLIYSFFTSVWCAFGFSALFLYTWF